MGHFHNSFLREILTWQLWLEWVKRDGRQSRRALILYNSVENSTPLFHALTQAAEEKLRGGCWDDGDADVLAMNCPICKFIDGDWIEPKKFEELLLKTVRCSGGVVRVLEDLQSRVMKAESKISLTPPSPTDLATNNLACRLGSKVAASNLVWLVLELSVLKAFAFLNMFDPPNGSKLEGTGADFLACSSRSVDRANFDRAFLQNIWAAKWGWSRKKNSL